MIGKSKVEILINLSFHFIKNIFFHEVIYVHWARNHLVDFNYNHY